MLLLLQAHRQRPFMLSNGGSCIRDECNWSPAFFDILWRRVSKPRGSGKGVSIVDLTFRRLPTASDLFLLLSSLCFLPLSVRADIVIYSSIYIVYTFYLFSVPFGLKAQLHAHYFLVFG